ncbi:MAG: NUDIX hydrolase N-terminal domain-containing protein [Rickettsiaceae bacterium]
MTLTTKQLTEHLSISDKIRAIAIEGMSYANDPYDIARYQKLLEISIQEFSNAIDIDTKTLKKKFQAEIGCITPKLGIEAAILNSQKQLLVLNRSDNTGWCLPCGWVDVGETPADAAIREIKEETNLDAEAKQYISISTKGPGLSQSIHHQVNIIVLTNIVSPLEIKLNHEHKEYKWINGVDNIAPWHPGHDLRATEIMNFINKDTSLYLEI